MSRSLTIPCGTRPFIRLIVGFLGGTSGIIGGPAKEDKERNSKWEIGEHEVKWKEKLLRLSGVVLDVVVSLHNVLSTIYIENPAKKSRAILLWRKWRGKNFPKFPPRRIICMFASSLSLVFFNVDVNVIKTTSNAREPGVSGSSNTLRVEKEVEKREREPGMTRCEMRWKT